LRHVEERHPQAHIPGELQPRKDDLSDLRTWY